MAIFAVSDRIVGRMGEKRSLVSGEEKKQGKADQERNANREENAGW